MFQPDLDRRRAEAVAIDGTLSAPDPWGADPAGPRASEGAGVCASCANLRRRRRLRRTGRVGPPACRLASMAAARGHRTRAGVPSARHRTDIGTASRPSSRPPSAGIADTRRRRRHPDDPGSSPTTRGPRLRARAAYGAFRCACNQRHGDRAGPGPCAGVLEILRRAAEKNGAASAAGRGPPVGRRCPRGRRREPRAGAADDGHEACGAGTVIVHDKDSTMPKTPAKTNRFAIGAGAAMANPPARLVAMAHSGRPRRGQR